MISKHVNLDPFRVPTTKPEFSKFLDRLEVAMEIMGTKANNRAMAYVNKPHFFLHNIKAKGADSPKVLTMTADATWSESVKFVSSCANIVAKKKASIVKLQFLGTVFAGSSSGKPQTSTIDVRI